MVCHYTTRSNQRARMVHAIVIVLSMRHMHTMSPCQRRGRAQHIVTALCPDPWRSLGLTPVSAKKIALSGKPRPCNPAAEMALQPMNCYSESLSSHMFSHPEEWLFLADTSITPNTTITTTLYYLLCNLLLLLLLLLPPCTTYYYCYYYYYHPVLLLLLPTM